MFAQSSLFNSSQREPSKISLVRASHSKNIHDTVQTSAQMNNREKTSYVRFEAVQKTYDGETLVVKDLNLDIQQGEFLTMLGPSGSGKTTCLMMLAGFENATHGEIYLDGRPINRLAPHKRDIGMVFQNYALFPHMTVAENLMFPLQLRHVDRRQARQFASRALEMVGLANLGDRRPMQLSGGQQQRVAVARALVFEPKLVLMDEPLGALDKQLREQMQMEIKHIHEKLGVTVVYVTHDQAEALTMSDRIAVFNDGKIQQLATPSELYEHPGNAFVAQFIGENNKLNAVVRDICDDLVTAQTPDGCIIKASKVAVGKIGEKTTLSLRPERVVLGAAPGSLENEFDAVIKELIYLGDHIRVRVAVVGQEDFVIKQPNSYAISEKIRPGKKIRVAWSARDCRALDS